MVMNDKGILHFIIDYCSSEGREPSIFGRKRLKTRIPFEKGEKWFLMPYFPLIRGMFLLRSDLRFSFWALEVPEPRVRKRPF